MKCFMPGVTRAAFVSALLAMMLHAASAGVVEDANAAMTRAFKAESPAPVLAARNLAILHLAMHDAVRAGNAKSGAWLTLPDVVRAESPEIAAREAANVVCRALYPGRSADFAVLNPPVIKTDAERKSAATGRSVAEAWLNARRDDGATTTVHYVPREALGQWRRTPPNERPPEMPHWGAVKPFCLKSGDQFRPAAPPGLDSAEYVRALDEVRRLGGNGMTERTGEQTMIAKFWSDFSYTSTPPGHWNAIARSLSISRDLNLEQSTRLFAMLNVGLADAGIAVWDCKYQWNTWRPVTAIRAAKTDGNDGTNERSDWLPLLATPPHPEYVSGHSAFSWAAATVLKEFFGSDRISFKTDSDSLPGQTRSFSSFTECAKEVGQSRVLGGIHFAFSNIAGGKLGKDIAAEVIGVFRKHNQR